MHELKLYGTCNEDFNAKNEEAQINLGLFNHLSLAMCLRNPYPTTV